MAFSPPSQIARPVLRLATQTLFFVLFALAPVFDLFRFDLAAGHAWIFGQAWHLGIEAFLAGRAGSAETGLNILFRLFLPLVGSAALFIYCAWRWGRLYCGWLCPHFSVVESINGLMRRAAGRHSVWDRQATAPVAPDGRRRRESASWWLPVGLMAVGFGFLWSVVLLTYLLPPAEIYGNLWHASLTPNQARFITIGTLILSLEFLFARHLFCRFGCAVGLFQSLAWMANRRALVVGFERARAADCSRCQALGADHGQPAYAACEAECPMRLRPRQAKQKMFACTQCTRCLSACATVQGADSARPLLQWVQGDTAQRDEAAVSLTGKRD